MVTFNVEKHSVILILRFLVQKVTRVFKKMQCNIIALSSAKPFLHKLNYTLFSYF